MIRRVSVGTGVVFVTVIWFLKISMSHLYSKNIHDLGEHVGNSSKINRQLSSRQSLKAKFDRESKPNESLFTEYSSELSRSNFSGGWCDAVSSSLPNVNAKRAWKSGTEKLSQTLNNVRSTFGIISQVHILLF